MNTSKSHKDKRNFHHHLKKKIFDMTTYLNQHRTWFKSQFLSDVVIIEYVEWLFSEHNVTLKYKTIEGEFDCRVDNRTFDEWLAEIQLTRNNKYEEISNGNEIEI